MRDGVRLVYLIADGSTRELIGHISGWIVGTYSGD